MTAFLLRRGVHLVVTMIALALVTFLLLHLAPGGPAQALLGPDQVSSAQEAAVEARLGLDQPLPVQALQWTESALRGDFGASYFYRQPALQVILDRLPNTLLLGVTSLGVAIALGIPAGLRAAQRPGGGFDRLAINGAVTLVATPAFWLGIILIYLFSVQLGWLPSSGSGVAGGSASWSARLRHLILPALTLGLPAAATLMLFVRSATIEALATDSTRTARSMGIPESRILRVHVLRQASIPVLMQIGLMLPHLLEGSIVVESVFSWPGIGQLTTASVGRRDYPILLALTLVIGLGVLCASILTDLAHAWLDPRIELR